MPEARKSERPGALLPHSAEGVYDEPVFAFTETEPRPHGERFAQVTVFRALGQQLAYFPRTGDLAKVSEVVYDTLNWYVDDVLWLDIKSLLVAKYGRAEARFGLADVRAMRDRGLLAPDAPEGRGEGDRWVNMLMRTKPRKLMLLVTEACNLACTYCYEVANGFHQGAKMMSLLRVREIIDRFFAESQGRSTRSITFFGGEPLLNFPAIVEGVRYAKGKALEEGVDIGFSVTTNLTLLTNESADFLVEHEFAVLVSLDGDKEANDRYRRTKGGKEGTYDTVVRNLAKLLEKQKAAGVRLAKIRSTLTSENSDPVKAHLHLSALTPLVMVGETHGTAMAKQEWDIAGEVGENSRAIFTQTITDYLVRIEQGGDWPERDEIERYLAGGLVKVHQEVLRTEVAMRPQVQLCGVCRNMKAVTPNGDLFPCHRYAGMSDYKIGNINEGGADSSAVAQYYGALHSAFEQKCRGCWARVICGGQCPWYLSGKGGKIRVPDEAGCRELRAGYQSSMALYTILLERNPEAFARILHANASLILGREGNVSHAASASSTRPDEVCGS